MRHTIAENNRVITKWDSGITPTITLYDLSDESIVGLNTANCNEVALTGVYAWSSSNITTPPLVFTEYLWIVTDGASSQYGKLVLGGFPDTILSNLTTLLSRVTASDRKSTRLNSSHIPLSRMPSSA